MRTSWLRKQVRQIPFTCIHPSHEPFKYNTRGVNRGDIVFVNNYGPLCHHCALLESKKSKEKGGE